MVSFSVCSVSLYDFPVFVGQQSRALFEQLGKTAGGGVADHLGDLAHGEVRVDQQVLRLAHAAALDVLGDAAPQLPLEAAFQLALAHAGDAGQPLQGGVEGVVVGDVADHVLQSRHILRRQGPLVPLALPLPGVHPRAMASVTLAS